jgi:hypothetical protein
LGEARRCHRPARRPAPRLQAVPVRSRAADRPAFVGTSDTRPYSGIDVPAAPTPEEHRSLQANSWASASELPAINDVLKHHTAAAADWRYSGVAKHLHDWAELFNAEFDLRIETPAIRLTAIRRAYGTYRYGRNSFGLRHEITLNTRYRNRPAGKWLETLLHELLHEWQDLHGEPSRAGAYHNKEFREKARTLGLLIDASGRSAGVVEGRFTVLLARAGVSMDDSKSASPAELERSFESRTAAASATKMRKWSCGCTNVRAAVVLHATCTACGNNFERAIASW